MSSVTNSFRIFSLIFAASLICAISGGYFLFNIPQQCTAVSVTTQKCYEFRGDSYLEGHVKVQLLEDSEDKYDAYVNPSCPTKSCKFPSLKIFPVAGNIYYCHILSDQSITIIEEFSIGVNDDISGRIGFILLVLAAFVALGGSVFAMMMQKFSVLQNEIN
ncbi:Hypothetical protein POVR1_LOCUS234 [uncultured virus]|nr:Hypothetical protein POVR1_LOCUS234 [uncultured virus]